MLNEGNYYARCIENSSIYYPISIDMGKTLSIVRQLLSMLLCGVILINEESNKYSTKREVLSLPLFVNKHFELGIEKKFLSAI